MPAWLNIDTMHIECWGGKSGLLLKLENKLLKSLFRVSNKLSWSFSLHLLLRKFQRVSVYWVVSIGSGSQWTVKLNEVSCRPVTAGLLLFLRIRLSLYNFKQIFLYFLFFLYQYYFLFICGREYTNKMKYYWIDLDEILNP